MPSQKAMMRERGTVQSVERSMDLLETLASSRGGIGIVDLSHRVGLHTSTTHRLLATLSVRGYVRQNTRSGHYSLGPRVLHLARAFDDQSEIRDIAHPFLQSLMRTSGETANLVMLDGDEAVYVDQAPSPQLVRMFAAIGRRVPLHSTGCGKVFLSQMDPAERGRIVEEKGLATSTRYTITTPASLEREIAEIRKRGYAVDNQEHDIGVRCIAAPIRNYAGETIAAISISGPTTRVTRERISELGRQVVATASDISAACGCQK